ncbi:hypothetical protein GGH12_005461 [Coemansia sp. RSA 1822]|nr:hypothetical protein LPJ76_005474 [Coemansia sp. RSA 638]KAJ2119363.1 hypothetical protein IW147_005943 [Coemansia sp. RSA 720]KAJ2539325.1 hypothetical protein GGF49_005303 [Coemansia sp. RSA 1853]KAJ2559291.1 hypothetical protein GGH12_005461 [Coemansia sp. RSA 1822]
MISRIHTAGRFVRLFTTTAQRHRVSDEFVKQFRLPGRTNSVLSTGVEPYSNDPMVPHDRYFKPRGLERSGSVLPLFLRRHPSTCKYDTSAFALMASPWNVNEHPRDYNGLRIRDYRVSIIAGKKHYKTAHKRWRVTRLIRTAASLVLPDKGLKRCDYMFQVRGGVLEMDRDELFLEVEQALVAVKQRVDERGVRQRPVEPEAQQTKSDGKVKILNAPSDRAKAVYSISDIVEDLGTRFVCNHPFKHKPGS